VRDRHSDALEVESEVGVAESKKSGRRHISTSVSAPIAPFTSYYFRFASRLFVADSATPITPSVEELVSRLRCSTFFLFLTIDTLYRGPRLTRIFLQCSEKGCKRYPKEVNFGPLIGGNLAHVVNFFCYDKFPVTRNKIDFPRNFEILLPGSRPRYSYKIFFPDGPWASPFNERKNLAPTREFGENGGQIFWGWSNFNFMGAIL